MVKLAVVKNKTKKETKLVFKCTENLNLCLLAELMGVDDLGCSEVEVKPKLTQTQGKGMFILSVSSNCPQVLPHPLCVRRVLTLRIKDTTCYFHFPLEVMFYPEGQVAATE